MLEALISFLYKVLAKIIPSILLCFYWDRQMYVFQIYIEAVRPHKCTHLVCRAVGVSHAGVMTL